MALIKLAAASAVGYALYKMIRKQDADDSQLATASDSPQPVAFTGTGSAEAARNAGYVPPV